MYWQCVSTLGSSLPKIVLAVHTQYTLLYTVYCVYSRLLIGWGKSFYESIGVALATRTHVQEGRQ